MWRDYVGSGVVVLKYFAIHSLLPGIKQQKRDAFLFLNSMYYTFPNEAAVRD